MVLYLRYTRPLKPKPKPRTLQELGLVFLASGFGRQIVLPHPIILYDSRKRPGTRVRTLDRKVPPQNEHVLHGTQKGANKHMPFLFVKGVSMGFPVSFGEGNPKGPRTKIIGFWGPNALHSYYSIRALKPHYFGPWTLRGR